MRLSSLHAVAVVAAVLVCGLTPEFALGKPVGGRRGGGGEGGKGGGGRGPITAGEGGSDGRPRPEGRAHHARGPVTRRRGGGLRSWPQLWDAAAAGTTANNGTGGPGEIPGQDGQEGRIGPLGMRQDPIADREQRHMKKAMGYMTRYGYIGRMDDDWETSEASMAMVRRGIRMAQRFMGLAETGELDEMTAAMMDKPRCGLPDMVSPSTQETNPRDAVQSFTHFGNRWDHTDITFRFLNYPSTMPESEVREAVIRAFTVWSDITPLTFREVGRTVAEVADFYIKFGARSHGDPYPFDGPGGVLAHAFLPKTNSGDLEGDIHFDDEEPFTYASYTGTNLFQVAAHEIGHSLGLSHSTDPSALMAPFYPGYQPTFYLPYDDLSGIQSLYGSNPVGYPPSIPYPNPPVIAPTTEATTTSASTTTSTSATTTSASTTTSTSTTTTESTSAPNPADPCRPVIDAVTVWRGEFFAFSGTKYGRIRDYWILSKVGGSEAGDFFNNFPSDIDAIYEDPFYYKLLMFKGPYFYVYEGLTLESGPVPISYLDPALPADLDAVFTMAYEGVTYFFKGELVWKYDELTKRVESGWPRRIDQEWPGLPSKLTGAWRDEGQKLTYFMSGEDYYRYPDNYPRAESGYPRDFIGDFFGCF